MRAGLALGIAVAVAITAGWQTQELVSGSDGKANRANLDVQESHASVSLLGQMRSNVSSWLWMKADLYLHNGVEMRPLTDDEKKRGKQVQGAADDGHERVIQEADVTVVPSKEEDFRGWFGDLERATTAYKDMTAHQHNDPMAALPLFRLMTWADPHFVPAWTTGATIISRRQDRQGTAQALEFLHDGLEQNPDSVEMLTEIGYLHVSRRKDLQTAVNFFESARMKGKLQSRTLDDDERLALQDCYRWLALCYRDLGQYEDLRRVVTEGLTTFPEDAVLSHVNPDMPMILTPEGRRVWLEANASK